MGGYSQIVLLCLISVYFWSSGEAACTLSSPEYSGCTSTYKNSGAKLTDPEGYCRLTNVYYDCLKGHGCLTEEGKQTALNLVESKTGVKCVSVYFWSEAKAKCTQTSPEFVACTNTFTQDGASLRSGEYSKYCGLLHVYVDCLKAKNCLTENGKNTALDLVENRTGIKCGSSVFGLNSFLVVSTILITAITNYF